MKIIKLKAANIKKIQAIEIDTHGNNVILSGPNGSGKTSTMDAIWGALQYASANKQIKEPIREGQDSAIAVVELDDYIVTRKWSEGGSTITVTDREGNKQSSPQTILDNIIGNLSFDPLEFSKMSSKSQSGILVELTGITEQTRPLEKRYKQLFDERTGLNRVIKDLIAQGKKLTKPADTCPDQEVSVSELNANLEAYRGYEDIIKKHNERIILTQNIMAQTAKDISMLEDQIASLESQLNQVKTSNTAAAAKLSMLRSEPMPIWTGDGPVEIREKILSAEIVNKQVRDKKQFLATKAEYDAKIAEKSDLEIEMHGIEVQRRELIYSAQYPLEGLALNPEDLTVTFKGRPWTDLSSGEKLKISTAMAMSLNPTLKVIFLRDASLLDRDSLAMIYELAAEKDYQVWAEIVESTDPTALQFIDGVIQGQDPAQIQMPSSTPAKRAEPKKFFEEVEDNPF